MTHIGGEPLSRLAMVLKPRYHFAGLQHTFYERIPYRLILFNVTIHDCYMYNINSGGNVETQTLELLEFEFPQSLGGLSDGLT